MGRRTFQSCPEGPPGEQAAQPGTGTVPATQSPASDRPLCPGTGWWSAGCGISSGSPLRQSRSPWRGPATGHAGQHSFLQLCMNNELRQYNDHNSDSFFPYFNQSLSELFRLVRLLLYPFTVQYTLFSVI
jgi:hypothetical protein